MIADVSLSAHELDDLIGTRGNPKSILSDYGTDLTSNAILSWTVNADVEWSYLDAGKSTRNAPRRVLK